MKFFLYLISFFIITNAFGSFEQPSNTQAVSSVVENVQVATDLQNSSTIDQVLAFGTYTQKGVSIIFQIFMGFIQNYIYYISYLLLSISLIIYYLSKKKLLLSDIKVKHLEKELVEKSLKIDTLKHEMQKIDEYYKSFIKSLGEPFKVVDEYFVNLKPNRKNSHVIEAHTQMVNITKSYKNLSDDIIIKNQEVNLNELISSIVANRQKEYENELHILSDFHIPILNAVSCDPNIIKNIIDTFLAYTCKYAPTNSRVLVTLNEVSSHIDGDVCVKVCIRGSKNGFSAEAKDNIKKAFDINLTIDALRSSEEIQQISIAKRLLNIIDGDVTFAQTNMHENGFLLEFTVISINRNALQEMIFSQDNNLNMYIGIIYDNLPIQQELKDDLSQLNITPKYTFNLKKFARTINDKRLMLDLLIMNYSVLTNRNRRNFIKKAKEKNYAILLILEENEIEDENIKNLMNIADKDDEDFIIIKSIKKPYKINDLHKKIINIHNQLSGLTHYV